MKNFKEKFFVVVGIFTIVAAIPTVVSMLDDVTHRIVKSTPPRTIQSSQRLKKDTITKIIRDTIVTEKKFPSDSTSAKQKEKQKQEQNFEQWKEEYEQDFEAFKKAY
jgi:hypothetical protein